MDIAFDYSDTCQCGGILCGQCDKAERILPSFVRVQVSENKQGKRKRNKDAMRKHKGLVVLTGARFEVGVDYDHFVHLTMGSSTIQNDVFHGSERKRLSSWHEFICF